MRIGESEENTGSHWGVLKMDEMHPPKRQQLQVYCNQSELKCVYDAVSVQHLARCRYGTEDQKQPGSGK